MTPGYPGFYFMISSVELVVRQFSDVIYTDFGLKFEAEIIQGDLSRSNGPVGIIVSAARRIFPKDNIALPSFDSPTWGYRVEGELTLAYPHETVPTPNGEKAKRLGPDTLHLRATSISAIVEALDGSPIGYDPSVFNNRAHALCGHIGKIHEPDGLTAVRSLAVTLNKQAYTNTPLWVKATFWGKQRDSAIQLLRPSTSASIEGSLAFKNWDDSQDRRRVEVNLKASAFKIHNKERSNNVQINTGLFHQAW